MKKAGDYYWWCCEQMTNKKWREGEVDEDLKPFYFSLLSIKLFFLDVYLPVETQEHTTKANYLIMQNIAQEPPLVHKIIIPKLGIFVPVAKKISPASNNSPFLLSVVRIHIHLTFSLFFHRNFFGRVARFSPFFLFRRSSSMRAVMLSNVSKSNKKCVCVCPILA